MNQAFLLNYSHAPKQTDGATHIVRTEMNKNMGALLEATQEEIEVALASKLPNSTGECRQRGERRTQTDKGALLTIWDPLSKPGNR